MEWILFGATLAASAIISLRYLHMLQLSSYQWRSYDKWFRDNRTEIFLTLGVPIFLAVLCTVFGQVGTYFVFGLYAIAAILSLPRQKVKKKLVMTARATRIYVLTLVITAAFVLVSMLLPHSYSHRSVIWVGSLPGTIILANWLLTPVQRAINNKYIRQAKQKLAAMPNLTLIGVTGSYGKTSLKYMLHAFLSTHYNTLMTPESYNTPMGVVKTIREQLNATHTMFVVEMGARHVGDIQEICDIVHPHHGVLTAIGPMHLETFGSMENIAATKLELLRSLPSDGYSFVNGDDEIIAAQDLKQLNLVRYGFADTDYHCSNLSVDRGGSAFALTLPDKTTHPIRTPLVGRHNVLNIVGAMAVAHTLGVPMPQLTRAAMLLSPVPHRLELKQQGGMTIIDDAFNANPAGAQAALETLAMMDGCKILVTPGMVELGERQDELNAAFGEQAAAVCDWVVLVGEQQTKPVAEGLRRGGFNENQLVVVRDIYQAFDWLHALDSGGRHKIVLLENDLPDNY